MRNRVWEAVQGRLTDGGTSHDLNFNTPVTLSQYSYQFSATASWEYFAFNVNDTARTRSLIFLSDLTDPGVQKVRDRLYDAYKSGKKLRWLRNGSSAVGTAPTAPWQGYSNTTYPIKAGDSIEMIFD